MSLLWYWLCLLVGWFLALLKPQSEASISFQFYYWQGPHGVLLIRWLVMSTSQKIKSQWSVRLTKLPKWHPVISLVPIFSKLRDHQIPDLGLRDHPFREFFISGVQEGLHQKGRTLVLLKSHSPSLFPLLNFPFLAWLPSLVSFSLHLPYIYDYHNPLQVILKDILIFLQMLIPTK